jgi:hypothetical protein
LNVRRHDAHALSDECGLENVLQSDPAEQFSTGAVGDGADGCSSVVVRTEMNSQRTLSEWHIDDIGNGGRDVLRSSILRRKLRKCR